MGKWHLVHLMASGLEKMLDMLSTGVAQDADDVVQTSQVGGGGGGGGLGVDLMTLNLEGQFFGSEMALGDQVFLGGEFFGLND